MQPAGRLAGQLLDVGQKGDDVVAGLGLDAPIRAGSSLPTARDRAPPRRSPVGRCPADSMAWQAASSTCNQVS